MHNSDLSDKKQETSTNNPIETIPEQEFLTIKQVAKILQIHPLTLSHKAKEWEEDLPRIRLRNSNVIRYRKSDVMNLFEKTSILNRSRHE